MARKIRDLSATATLDPDVAERNARVLEGDADELGPSPYANGHTTFGDGDQKDEPTTGFTYSVRPDGVVDNVIPESRQDPTLDNLGAQEAELPTVEQLTEALVAWRVAQESHDIAKAEAKEAKEHVNACLARVQKLTDRLRAGKQPKVLPDWVTGEDVQPGLPLYDNLALDTGPDATQEAPNADADTDGSF